MIDKIRVLAGILCILIPLSLFAEGNAADDKSKATQLPEVVVESDAETGYLTKQASTATKTDTPIMETPQAITVINSKQMEDQGAQSVQDALRYTAGVRGETYGLDSRGDWSTIRGSDPVVFLDGMQQTFGYYASSRPDPFTLESIEVIKGPSSVLYGQGSVGGIVNLNSKQPLEEKKGKIEAEYGTFDRRQVGVDLTGPANEDGSVLYRLIALGRDSNTQVNYVEDNRALFMPSITWKPNEEIQWTVTGVYQDDNTGSSTQFLPHAGTVLPAPYGLPQISSDIFMSEPGFDNYDTTTKSVTSKLSYKPDDIWTLRQNLRFSDSSVNYRTIYPAFPPALQENGDIDRVFWVAKPDLRYWTIDNQVQADLESDSVKQKVLLGVDSQYAVTTRTWAYGSAGTLNMYDPVYGNFTAPGSNEFYDDPKNTVEQMGVYLQDQITLFDRWIAVAGLRSDSASNKTAGPDSYNKQEDDKITKRAGLMYKADNGLSPYVSYSESFLPIVGVNQSGEQFDPLEGEQYEVGIKFQPKNSESYITAAVYDLTEKNRQTPDPNDPLNQIQAGETEAKGFEFEALGKITETWSLIGTYSYTDTEVVEGTPGYDDGKNLPSVPENMASLWAQHEFSIGGIDGFRAGAGVRYVGSSWDGTDTLKTPSTTLFDAMVAFDYDNWTFAVNANNLEDKNYYTTCLARGDCFIGTGRTIVGSATYNF